MESFLDQVAKVDVDSWHKQNGSYVVYCLIVHLNNEYYYQIEKVLHYWTRVHDCLHNSYHNIYVYVCMFVCLLAWLREAIQGLQTLLRQRVQL